MSHSMILLFQFLSFFLMTVFEILLQHSNLFRKRGAFHGIGELESLLRCRDLRKTTSLQPCQRCGA